MSDMRTRDKTGQDIAAGDFRSHRPRFERDAMAWPPTAWDDQPVAVDGAIGQAVDGSGPGAGRTAGSGDLSASAVAVEALQTLLLALVLFVGLRVVVQNYVVESYSMEPTLYEGQQIWVNKLLYKLSDGPERGDIIVFQSWNQDKPFIKRVVGLPGETITVHDGQVYADGYPVDEPYLGQPTNGSETPVVLGADEYFVLGDNRGNSGDSRSYGSLPGDDIIGKAWLRYWPPRAVGLLTDPGVSHAADRSD
ncbi:MAG: signal peptidase I [Anaerolineae bacterium]